MNLTKDSLIPLGIVYGVAALQPSARFIDENLSSTTDAKKAIQPKDAIDRLAGKLEELIGRPYETEAEFEHVKTVWDKIKRQISEYVRHHASANYPTALYITVELIHLLEVRFKSENFTGVISAIPEGKSGLSKEVLQKFVNARNALFISRVSLKQKCRQIFAEDNKDKHILWLRQRGADITTSVGKGLSSESSEIPYPKVDEAMSLESVMLTALTYEVRNQIQKCGVEKVAAIKGFLNTLASSDESQARKEYLIKWLELAETDFDDKEGHEKWRLFGNMYLKKYLGKNTGYVEVNRVLKIAKELFDHQTTPLSEELGINIASVSESMPKREFAGYIDAIGQKSGPFFGRYARQIVKKCKDTKEAELEFYHTISSRITEAIAKSGKKKKQFLEEYGGLGSKKASLPTELQDISVESFARNLDDIIAMDASVNSSRITRLYEEAKVCEKLEQLSLKTKEISPKTRKNSRLTKRKKPVQLESRTVTAKTPAPLADTSIANKEVAALVKTLSPKLPVREFSSAFCLHDRVARWFNPTALNDPFTTDPKYKFNTYSDIAKRKITIEHNFGLIVDTLLADYGIEDANRNKFLVGEIEVGEERWKCILLYCFTKEGVCFHRFAHRKSAKEVLDKHVEFAEKGIMELEYPKVSDLIGTKEYVKQAVGDGSYIKSQSENTTTISDPKNNATIRIWTERKKE